MPFDPVTKTTNCEVMGGKHKAPWSGTYQVLTPQMREASGALGMVRNVLPTGSVGAPFHWHLREDEVFYILSGRGVLRYGSTLTEVSPGDCISCPAGTTVAHQLANPYPEDLVYLSVGLYDPHEVCGYPDSGKVMVRGLKTVGVLHKTPYLHDEPEPAVVFALHNKESGQ